LEVATEPTLDGGKQALEVLLRQSAAELPTAVFCASLLQAIGALGGLRANALQVPRDVSVVAFNDHALAAHTDPPLTTVRLPNFDMGWEAMKMLIRASEGSNVSDRMIDVPPTLISRASTGPPRNATD
jgi:DNA-binding LacI/PurR family transcriptional regulator